MKKLFLVITIIVFSASMYSCSSVTEVTGTWKKPGTTAKKYTKIMVKGVSSDVVKRASVENAVVNDLRRYGINAVAGSNIFPDTFIDSDSDGKVDKEDKTIIADKLKELGIDGVFMISLMDVKEDERYVPGTTYYTPYVGYYPFYNYYWNTYNVVHSPGYYTKSTNYFLSSNFYDLSNEQLIWSAQSETFNPQSLSDFSKSFAGAVTEDFVSSGVVRK